MSLLPQRLRHRHDAFADACPDGRRGNQVPGEPPTFLDYDGGRQSIQRNGPVDVGWRA